MSRTITIEDIRASGHCVRGAAEWFRSHNLDFRDFLKNGATSDVLLATGDALAERVVEHVSATDG